MKEWWSSRHGEIYAVKVSAGKRIRFLEWIEFSSSSSKAQIIKGQQRRTHFWKQYPWLQERLLRIRWRIISFNQLPFRNKSSRSPNPTLTEYFQKGILSKTSGFFNGTFSCFVGSAVAVLWWSGVLTTLRQLGSALWAQKTFGANGPALQKEPGRFCGSFWRTRDCDWTQKHC